MKKRIFTSQRGSSPLLIVSIVLLLAGVGLAGWYVWQKNQNTNEGTRDDTAISQDAHKQDVPPNNQKDGTQAWTTITTQGKAFTMKVPDGWQVSSYPGDFLGATKVDYVPGAPATNGIEDADYMGHMLRFRASITKLDDAGLGRQWESPQPGLEESVEDFSTASLNGKRFKGVFTGDIHQTLYEYVFDVGQGKKLDVVYTVYHEQGDEDQTAIVEKAIRTIQLK